MLFWIIVIILIIYLSSKKRTEGTPQQRRYPMQGNDTSQNMQSQNVTTMQEQPYAPRQQRVVTSAERQRLEQYRSQKAKNASKKDGDILARAQQNVKRYEKDKTMEQLELEHMHSEQVKPTMVKESLKQAKDNHPHDAAHVSAYVGEQSDSLLGTIEDLMVKGYDGNLSFERDFVGEALDMINRFTAPDTISFSADK